ncbi:hypothetical protein B0T17DRAFT_510245 [Bombardia bombarda]|uniref:Uncharacterized protein n=1 Tax=Bombardia bombarda TaxID=252184 RepID=A0AA39WHU0_9PEZI|nr:hypothetical protein B0T17DRAFT_510245 [Bombardia bombarda]
MDWHAFINPFLSEEDDEHFTFDYESNDHCQALVQLGQNAFKKIDLDGVARWDELLQHPIFGNTTVSPLQSGFIVLLLPRPKPVLDGKETLYYKNLSNLPIAEETWARIRESFPLHKAICKTLENGAKSSSTYLHIQGDSKCYDMYTASMGSAVDDKTNLAISSTHFTETKLTVAKHNI